MIYLNDKKVETLRLMYKEISFDLDLDLDETIPVEEMIEELLHYYNSAGFDFKSVEELLENIHTY